METVVLERVEPQPTPGGRVEWPVSDRVFVAHACGGGGGIRFRYRVATNESPYLNHRFTEAWELKTTYMPLSWAFKGDVHQWVKQVWPNLYVHRELAANKPSRLDPLAAAGQVQIAWDSDTFLVRVTYGSENTPWLEPRAMLTYLLIQWPELFKVFDDGKQT